MSPSLYGLDSSNSGRVGLDLWGKNQFNSTFPLALCLKMRDDNACPVYVKVVDSEFGPEIRSDDDTLEMSTVVGAKHENMYYEFESVFPPYREVLTENIDIVVSKKCIDGSLAPVRPLEVKLTVVPDSSTLKKSETQWAPELVIRPVTSAYAMMGLVQKLRDDGNKVQREEISSRLGSVYRGIQDWNNITEISTNAGALSFALFDAIATASELQSPYLVQPIWKTEGQSLRLCRQCFDVFVWSDVAIVCLPLDNIRNARKVPMSRHLREVARHVRFLYAACSSSDTGHFRYSDCYGGMPLGNQTSKSFSISGTGVRKYLVQRRLQEPFYPADVLGEIILNEGERLLKPERRFDAAVSSQFASGKMR